MESMRGKGAVSQSDRHEMVHSLVPWLDLKDTSYRTLENNQVFHSCQFPPFSTLTG